VLSFYGLQVPQKKFLTASPPKPKLLDQVRQAIRARLIYGGGLRLLECCRLRVKDIDFSKTRLSFEQARAIKIAIRCFLARLAGYIGTCKRGCVFWSAHRQHCSSAFSFAENLSI